MAEIIRFAPCRQCQHLLDGGSSLLAEDDWSVQEIGSGANGRVYMASCLKTSCVHAVKVVHPESSWLREVFQLKANPFPFAEYLVQLMLAGYTDHRVLTQNQGTVFAIMQELLDADLFNALYRTSSYPWAAKFMSSRSAIWDLAFNSLKGLRELDLRGISHGDIKPENIMLQRRPNDRVCFKLTDFGHSYLASEKTHTGGTPVYLPPEHVVGENVESSTADLFSLGLVLAEVFHGTPILPPSLIKSYDDPDEAVKPVREWYHLVVLASLIRRKPTWAGHIVRSYGGQQLKAMTMKMIHEQFRDAAAEIDGTLATLQCVKECDRDLFDLIRVLLSSPKQRPPVEHALDMCWRHSISEGGRV